VDASSWVAYNECLVEEVPAPTLVVLSGPPASGKTTLAHALAEAIACPAICRDEIKEGMVHAFGSGYQAGPGDPLTMRTLPVFFDVLRLLATAGVTVVAEAAFQDARWREGIEPLSGLVQFRIVQCTVDDDVARERLARLRAAHGDRSPGALKALAGGSPFADFDRLSLPVPSIVVDTTDGYAPDLPAIVEFVNRP
jgi:predicted kinase